MSETDIFYNLKVGRGYSTITTELRALASEYDPVILAGTEGNGYTMPFLKGRDIVRDRSREGRANLWAYVRNDVKFKPKWHDLHKEFPRKDHPGMHPARSILELTIKDGAEPDQVIISHAPPAWPGAGPARAEWREAMLDLLKPSRFSKRKARLVLMDGNGFGDDIARAIDGELQGDPTNATILVRLDGETRRVRSVPTVKPVVLGSDHPAQVTRLR